MFKVSKMIVHPANYFSAPPARNDKKHKEQFFIRVNFLFNHYMQSPN